MRTNEKMRKVLSVLLALCMVMQYIPTVALAAETDGLCAHHTVHTAECGYAPAAAEVVCTHEHTEGCSEQVTNCLHAAHDESCGGLEDAAACTHVCSADSGCITTALNCGHNEDGSCCYVAAVAETPCSYAVDGCPECDIEEEKTTEPSTETSEPTTETTEPALVCNCGTDDPAIHATTCAVYVAPENPVCYCAEKCTEPNVWCDVCGFDYTQCAGQDAMTSYDETTADPVTLDIANGTITISATGYKQYRADEIAYTGSYIITGTGTNNITVSGLADGATIILKDLSITSTQPSLNLQAAVPVAATGSVQLGSGTCVGSAGAITITGDADLVLTSTTNQPAVIAAGEVNIQCNSLSLTAQGLAFKNGVTTVTVDAKSNITASTNQTAPLIPCAAQLTAGGSISLTAQNGPVVSGNADLTAGEDITLSTKGPKTVGGTATLNYAGTLTETTSKGTATEEHVHSFENGICTGCGTTCSHEDYEDGKCTSCGTECPHKSYSDGKCTVCGALALVKVQVGESVTYYPGIDEANAYAGTLESGDTVYITLLGDTGASDSIFKFAAKTIVLDLNGHTMTVQRLQYESGADVTVKDSGADGTIQVTLDHYVSNGASLTLKSGSILNSNTGHPAVYVKGSFNMTGGTVSGANQAINVQSGEKVHISGGTISGGSSKALTNPGGVKNIFLSGGTYIGGINASPGYGTIKLSDILAQGYKLVDEDGSDVELYNSTVDGTVKVVCAHTLDHADNKPATCKAPAYCGNCGVTYGEPDADAHSFGAGGLCTNGCGTQAQAKIDNTFYLTFAKAAEEVTEGSTITVFTDVTIGEAESLNFPYFVTLSVAEGKAITCDGTVTIGEEKGIIFENQLYYLGALYESSGSDFIGINLQTATPNAYYPAGDGYAIFEGDGTLRLHNAEITTPDSSGTGMVYAIYSTEDLTIHFSGNNHLTSGNTDDTNAGIYVKGDLTLIAVGENAELTARSGNSGGGNAGIEAKSLTVNGGTVTAIGGDADKSLVDGIQVETNLTVNSGTVYARGGSGGMSLGVVVTETSGTITVADGAALYATGGEGTVYSAGVFAGTVSDNVNALGLTVSETENAGTMAYTVYGNLVLTENRTISNPYAGQEGDEEFTVTVTFTVPAGTSLTVNEGVTLDLSALAVDDIHFDGTIINNGTIILPDTYIYETIPEKLNGNVTIGDKSYNWNGEKWICGEGSHTGTFADLGDGNHGYECSVCQTQISEPHAYNDSHICTGCGVTETYTITVATEGITANVAKATYGQDCKITLTSPENTLIYKADAVYTDTNASVPGYTFENGVLTIPGEAVTGDMTVKAMIQVWITIYSNGATLNPGTEDFEAREGEVVSEAYLKLQLDYKGDTTAEELMEIMPMFYAKEGYTLTSINSKENGNGTAYTTGTLPLEQHLTVYLQWEVNTYSYQVETYTMDEYGNYELTGTEEKSAPYGTAVDATPANVDEGFYLDTENADSLLEATVPGSDDLVLKVYIGRNKYPITWDLNGGGTYYDDLPEKMYYGTSQLNVWDGFTREGYTFSHLEDQFGNKYEDATPDSDNRRFPNVTMPIGGLTLKVMWTVNQYTITFDPDNGEEKVTITQDYGTTITAPQFTKDGCHFLKWDTDVPATMPGEDLTITAEWEAHYGGTATCEELAKCSKCSTGYGELLNHVMDPATGLCGNGCEKQMAQASVTKNGTTTYHETLDRAIQAVSNCNAADNAEVKLLKTIDLGDYYQQIYSGVFTLDLNGNKFMSELWMYDSANITITDSAGRGGIDREGGNGVAVVEGGTVTIDDVSIIGYTGVYADGGNVTIQDGTITAAMYGVYAKNGSIVTIQGGTIHSNDHGVLAENGSTVTIQGGSISGDFYDLYSASNSTITLTLAEGKDQGAVFPGGLSSGKELNSILDKDLAYWQDGRQVDITVEQTEITGGDVTVKKDCDHSTSQHTTVTNNGDGTHSFTCTVCNTVSSEACSGGTATCEELATCGKCGTEYGELAEHTPGYTASGKTITETCEVCETVTGTATIFAEDVTYTGEVYTGAYTEYSWMGDEPTIRYNTDNGSAPVKAGTYTVSITYGDATASDPFTISPKDIANCSVTLSESSFVYSGKAPELTVNAVDNGVGSYKMAAGIDYTVGTISGINVGEYTLTVTGMGNYTGTVNLEYTINAKEVSITGTEIQAVTYDPDGYTLTVTGVTFNGVVEGETLDYSATAELKGTNAAGTQGTEVTVTLNNSNYVLKQATVLGTVTINKAAPTVTTAPSKMDLTYNGNPQALVSAGSTTDGTLYYSLVENGGYSTTIPTGTNAGDYTVWYYIQGDENHSDSEATSISVTIARKELTPAVSGSVTKVYDGTTDVPDNHNLAITMSGIASNDDVSVTATYAYDGADAGTTKINATNITLGGADAGNYKLKSTTASADVGTITKAASSVTKEPEAISGLKFQEANGKEVQQSLVTAGEATGGTMVYRLDSSDEWSEDIPTAGQVRNYTVSYKVLGDSNHNDTEENAVAVTIAKADAPTVTIPAQTHFYTIPTTGNRIDIKSLLPNLCAIITNQSSVTATTGDFIKNAVLNDGILTYDTVAASAPATGTITVKIVMRNYEDVTVTVNVELIDLNPVSNSGTDAEITYNGSTYDVAQMFTKDTNAGEASYEISGGSGAGELNGSVLTITKAGTIEIKLTTAANGTYAAGEATATLTVKKADGAGTVSMDGWTYGENAKTPTTENGTGTAIFLYTGSGYSSAVVPTDAGTYTVTATFVENDLYKAATATDTFVIAQKELIPSISGNVSKTYDGTTTVPDGLSIMLDGIVIGDSISATATYAYDGADAGTTKINATNITLGGADAGNYKLKSTTASADVGTITKAASSVTKEPEAISGLKFNGQEQALITPGEADGGKLLYSVDGSTWSESVPTMRTPNEYHIYYKVVGDSNHTDWDDGGGIKFRVTISKADAPTVVIPNQQHICFAATSGNTINLAEYLPADCGTTTYGTPSVNGDFFTAGTAVDASGILTYGTKAMSATDSGTIKVPVTMGNYQDVLVTINVELTEKIIVTVTVPSAQNGTYNGAAQKGYTGTPSAEGFTGDFVVTYAGRNGTVYESTDKAPVNAGDYTVTFSIPDSDLHLIGSASVNFTIVKAQITITAESKTAYTGDAVPALNYTVTGILQGEQLITLPTTAVNADMEKAGCYTITVSGADAGSNYNITYVNGTLLVMLKTPATSSDVMPEDKDALADTKEDLEDLLTENKDSLTEDQKQDIQDELEKIDDAITALENVEKVTEAIKDLPKTVKPDDEEAAKKILDAKKAYDALTAHEKSLVDKNTKQKLNNLVAALTAYDIIKGDGSTWIKGSSNGLSFTANGPFRKFVGIEVDGKTVNTKYYDAKAGSTVITLKKNFLNRLSVGTHTITVLYTDGETSGTFKIWAASANPPTGDDFHLLAYAATMCASMLGLAGLLAERKRRMSKAKVHK